MLRRLAPQRLALAATATTAHGVGVPVGLGFCAAEYGWCSTSSLLSSRRSYGHTPEVGGWLRPSRRLLQGIPIVKQAIDDADATLFAKAGYTIFVLASLESKVETTTDSKLHFALYCATFNRLFVFEDKPDMVSSAAQFMLQQTDPATFAASILFPSDASASMVSMTEALSKQYEALEQQAKVAVPPSSAPAAVSNRRCVVGPDCWSVVYAQFKSQQDQVRTLTLPNGFEHASSLLSNRRFAPLNVPSIAVAPNVAGIPDIASMDLAFLVNQNSVVRRALLTWDAMFTVHKRFGTVGTKKALGAIDLIIRRAVKAVNIFVIDIDSRLGKGSVKDGTTMIVTIFNAQTGSNTVHNIRNLAEETVKLNALTALLYGEGISSVAILIPSPRTKESQLTAFARICKPKCPFFVVQPTAASAYFQQPSTAYNFVNVTDPKVMFSQMIAASFPGAPKKDEAVNSLKLRKALTHLGHKLYDDRVGSAVRAFAAGVSRIPVPKSANEDFHSLQPVASPGAVVASSTTFLNSVSRDMEALTRLDAWMKNIYDNPERLKREHEALSSIQRYLVVDLETTTVKRYKRVANPFTKENWIVLSGALDYNGKVFMPNTYFDKDTAQNYHDPALCAKNKNVKGSSKFSLFLPPLDDYDIIVGHNIKFDLLHIWNDVELKRFLKRGGKIWDTMYAEYLLTGHQVKLGRGAGLEDVAKSYGGTTPKLDMVKQAWAQGKATYDIPYATLREYLEGDLKNTELIFLKHRERALAQRQVIIVNARMDSLLATTEMEFNGLKIDVPLAIKQSNVLVGQAMKKKASLDASIPPEIPPKLRRFFNWASNMMLIQYFFGGRLKLVTGNRSSGNVTGERVPRHLIFGKEEDYPTSEYPYGVFLASQQNAAAAGDCVVVTTAGEAEKGTRIFTVCVEHYMRHCGFRKSSTLADSLSKQMVPVCRKTRALITTQPNAIANLLVDRSMFLYASITTKPAINGASTSDVLQSLTLYNPLSKTFKTFENLDQECNLKALPNSLEEHLKSEVAAFTVALVPPPGANADPSMTAHAFVDAQVFIIARDAPFTFFRTLVASSPEVGQWIERRMQMSPGAAAVVEDISSAKQPLDECFSIAFVDATSTVLFYRSLYGAVTDKAWEGGKPPTDRNLVMLPEFIPKPKGKTAVSMIPMMRSEVTLSPQEWCLKYSEMLDHIGKTSFIDDAAQPLAQKKARKNAPPPKPDEDLPLLLRRRPYVKESWLAMPHDQQTKLALMIVFGRAVGSSFDPFVEPSPFDDTVEIPIAGKLAQYIPNEADHEPILKKFRSPVTRQLQVGDESLTYFAKTHQDLVAKTIMDLRGDEKLIGTYYEHTEGGTGMVSLTHKIDSCIHHELIHNKTNTGRLASANPNCQNIPKEDKSDLREMFVSRFRPDGVCIEVDYSQLEVITLAALSKDPQMIEDLVNNVDFHCKRVTMIRPDLSYAEVVQRAKKNKEPEFVKLRQQAKIFSFQRQYGAGVTMLSQSTGLSPDQVRQLIEREREIYRGVDVFANMVTISANKYDGSLQDGSRNIRGHQFYKGMFPVITGSRYIFTESDVPESMLRDKPESMKSTNFSPTHLKNYPVQGFAGEIVQIMLGRLWRHFAANNNYNGKALLMNTVHDCVWVDTTKDVYIEVAKDVERILSSAQATLNELWPEMQCNVGFGVDIVAGDNMCHLRPLPKDAMGK